MARTKASTPAAWSLIVQGVTCTLRIWENGEKDPGEARRPFQKMVPLLLVRQKGFIRFWAEEWPDLNCFSKIRTGNKADVVVPREGAGGGCWSLRPRWELWELEEVLFFWHKKFWLWCEYEIARWCTRAFEASILVRSYWWGSALSPFFKPLVNYYLSISYGYTVCNDLHFAYRSLHTKLLSILFIEDGCSKIISSGWLHCHVYDVKTMSHFVKELKHRSWILWDHPSVVNYHCAKKSMLLVI